eukprot:1511723-Pyramimonas_sp.AAC.1
MKEGRCAATPALLRTAARWPGGSRSVNTANSHSSRQGATSRRGKQWPRGAAVTEEWGEGGQVLFSGPSARKGSPCKR